MSKKKNKKNIPISSIVFVGNEKKYVDDCINTIWISSLGKYVSKFEKKFAEYVGTKYAITCCNGTTALHLALLALGIKEGDEVICPTLTYVATANSIIHSGAKPVFIDCKPNTFDIDPEKIKDFITPKTKAIIMVSLYGHACDYSKIKKIAKEHKLRIIEDSAQSFGSTYKGKACGSSADISTFSFFGNKIITCGEGGMVVTNNRKWFKKIKLYKNQGMSHKKRYWHDVIGYNYRMTNLAAAIGLAQLEKANLFLSKRQNIADLYTKNLQGLEKYITLPKTKRDATNSYWMYYILTNKKVDRNKLIRYLKEKGIETRPFFYPMHSLPMYKNHKKSDVSVSESISVRGINLPTFHSLNEKDILYITNSIKEYFS